MDEGNDLFGIAISDDEEAVTKQQQREARTTQTEAAFQAVRAEYQPKLENGENYKTLQLPLAADVAKPDALAAIQAVEELYFYRRFDDAAHLASRIILGRGGLDEETVQLLRDYEERSRKRAAAAGSSR